MRSNANDTEITIPISTHRGNSWVRNIPSVHKSDMVSLVITHSKLNRFDWLCTVLNKNKLPTGYSTSWDWVFKKNRFDSRLTPCATHSNYRPVIDLPAIVARVAQPAAIGYTALTPSPLRWSCNALRTLKLGWFTITYYMVYFYLLFLNTVSGVR